DLAALADAALVPQAVARALRVPEAPGCPLTETLQEALGVRQLLLMLDNCEHLIDACARLVDTLLSGCPHLRVLATSRQPLGLTGEVAWRVPSLSLPDPTEGPRGKGQGSEADATATRPSTLDPRPSTLLRSAAVRLFVERARAAEVSFEMTPHNAAAIAQVC